MAVSSQEAVSLHPGNQAIELSSENRKPLVMEGKKRHLHRFTNWCSQNARHNTDNLQNSRNRRNIRTTQKNYVNLDLDF
uniref:Interferon induced protein with tetratricopeptide repeats 3 n=1 Tax=Homo sapiens TaxID=9606 RepID=A0A7P0Z4G0_HUMAN